MKVAKKVFRKVKMETSMPGDDLWLSLDNVVMGEMFAEAQSISRRGGNPTPSRFSRLSPRTGEGEAVDRDQREGGEDAGRVRGVERFLSVQQEMDRRQTEFKYMLEAISI